MHAFRSRGLLALLLAIQAAAAQAEVWDYFQRGRVEAEAGAGIGAFGGNDYLTLELGGAYYLRDGLSVGLTGEAWLGASPQIYDFSPQVRYVLTSLDWRFLPYVGTFYRRTYYSSDYSPLNSAGVRAGLAIPLGQRAYLTGGGVYEHYFACDTNVYSSCDALYPEVGLAFAF